MKLILKSLCILTLLAMSACSSKVYAPGEIPQASLAPTDEIKSFANGLNTHFKKKGIKTYRSGGYYQKVKAVSNKILKAAGLKANSLPIVIKNDPEINAAVYKGQTIVVNTGLMKFVKSNDELATVLSHEVGHVLALHHKDNSKKKRTSYLKLGATILGTAANIAITAYTGSDSAGDLAGNVTTRTSALVGYGAYVQSYGRSQERQADDIGLNLMVKAGYKPQAAIAFWERFAEHRTKKVSSFLSSHPQDKDRAKRIAERIPLVIEELK